MNNIFKYIFLSQLMLVLGMSNVFALDKLEITQACSFFGETTPQSVYTFSSDKEADNVIQEIVDISGLPKNFQIRAAGVPNAAAVLIGEERYILYSQTFMRDLRGIAGNDWAAYAVMAHEIGHHLAGHTLTNSGSRPQYELEADRYSGFVLQKLGASLKDASSVIQEIGIIEETTTHPGKHDRLAAISNGWIASCESDAACASANKNPIVENSSVLAKKKQTAKKAVSSIASANPKAVKRLQEMLLSKNCRPGPIDGIFGGKTELALKRLLSLNLNARSSIEKEKKKLNLYKTEKSRDYMHLEMITNMLTYGPQMAPRGCI